MWSISLSQLLKNRLIQEGKYLLKIGFFEARVPIFVCKRDRVYVLCEV